MLTVDIFGLVQLLSKKHIGSEGDQIIVTSASCPDYELTLDATDDGNGVVWNMAIDPTPYDEDTMGSWLRLEEIAKHPASAYSDWRLDRDTMIELLTKLAEDNELRRPLFDKMTSILSRDGEE